MMEPMGDVMEEIVIPKLKAKCLAVLDRVRKTRKQICITRHGTPVAEVIPPSSVQERSAWIGSMKDSVEILGDIISTESLDRKSTRLNSSHTVISYAVFCLKKKKDITTLYITPLSPVNAA